MPVFLCLHATEVLTWLYFHMPIFDLHFFLCLCAYIHAHAQRLGERHCIKLTASALEADLIMTPNMDPNVPSSATN